MSTYQSSSTDSTKRNFSLKRIKTTKKTELINVRTELKTGENSTITKKKSEINKHYSLINAHY